MSYRAARRGIAVISVGILAVTGVQAAATAAVSPSRVTVPGSVPTWATPSHLSGTPSTSSRIAVRVGLALRGGTQAEKFVAGVSNPASKQYGHYLTPAAFTARFAPTQASVQRVESYLRGSGLHVDSVATGRLWIAASGTVAAVNKAFGTTLRTYAVQGKTLRAPAKAATLPTAVASAVTTVAGLSSTLTPRLPQTRRVPDNMKSAKARAAAPTATKPPASQCSDYWGEYQQTVPKAYGRTTFNTYICGYTPAQLRKAYGTTNLVKKGTDGNGVTVAIIDAYASPTMLADANAYAAAVGEPAFRDGQYTETVFTPFNLQDECAGEAGWNGEETLDVEAVHGMAPGANIHYIGAQNCDAGIDDALNYVVQNHTADIVSNSYGNLGEDVPADEVALEHSIFLQAGSEGIGMYFSSGDSGDEVVNGLTPQPDYSASDPNVTAVGGTSLLLDKRNERVAETGWETSLDFIDYSGTAAVYSDALPGDFVFGAGGGTSTLFKEPYYQQGTVPTGLAKAHGPQAMRVVPDISADADPYTGFYIGETVDGTFGISSIGGTSLACPLIAGIQAVASQHRKFAIGFANPLLYSMNKSSYRDVKPIAPLHFVSVSGAYLGTFETGDSQYTARGYDDITGRGTPNGAIFVRSEK